MYLKYYEDLRRGFTKLNRIKLSPPISSNLLESLRCHNEDEYPVFSAEDDGPIPPLACSFSKVKNTAHILAVVDENGSTVIYDTNKSGEDATVTDWTAHNNAVFDLKWMATEQKVLTASGDQTVCLWDVHSKAKLLTFKGHTSSVRSVGFRPQDDASFASGSRDGHVRLWDVRCNVKDKKVSSVNVIRNAHMVNLQPVSKRKKSRPGTAHAQFHDSQQSVTCVMFQNDYLLTTAGAVDGCVKVWDIRKIKTDNSETVYNFPYTGTSKRTHGYSSLTFDNYYSRLYASCTDDIIYCYDFVTYKTQPVSTYRGHRNTSFYVRAVVSPDDQYLLSGSSDENAYIWQIDKPNISPIILKGHTSEISDVAWCKTDLFRLVTTSDDNTIRVWRYDPTAETRKQLGRSDTMCDISGTAQRTHRDIGTSAEAAPSTPKQSSPTSLKRASTLPFGVVTELTPKRAKTATVTSASPTLQMWLKRSASEPSPQAGTSSGAVGPKRLKLRNITEELDGNKESDKKAHCDKTKVTDSVPNTPNKSQDNLTKADTNIQCENINNNIVKKDDTLKQDSLLKKDGHRKQSVSKGNATKNSTPKVSCKRKLVEDENSPEKSKRRKVNEELNVDKTVTNCDSPTRKRDMVLRDLDSDINASPVNRAEHVPKFYTPSRVKMLDFNSENIVQSPTSNLPNLVTDTPLVAKVTIEEENKTKTVDWLTKMRIQKLATQSPPTKSCHRKLLDKMNQSSQESKNGQQPLITSSPKIKSPARGVKSISSFFQRQTAHP